MHDKYLIHNASTIFSGSVTLVEGSVKKEFDNALILPRRFYRKDIFSMELVDLMYQQLHRRFPGTPVYDGVLAFFIELLAEHLEDTLLEEHLEDTLSNPEESFEKLKAEDIWRLATIKIPDDAYVPEEFPEDPEDLEQFLSRTLKEEEALIESLNEEEMQTLRDSWL